MRSRFSSSVNVNFREGDNFLPELHFIEDCIIDDVHFIKIRSAATVIIHIGWIFLYMEGDTAVIQ